LDACGRLVLSNSVTNILKIPLKLVVKVWDHAAGRFATHQCYLVVTLGWYLRPKLNTVLLYNAKASGECNFQGLNSKLCNGYIIEQIHTR